MHAVNLLVYEYKKLKYIYCSPRACLFCTVLYCTVRTGILYELGSLLYLHCIKVSKICMQSLISEVHGV